jgi:hypothetical protein
MHLYNYINMSLTCVTILLLQFIFTLMAEEEGKVIINSPQALAEIFNSKFCLIKINLSRLAFRNLVKYHMATTQWVDFTTI